MNLLQRLAARIMRRDPDIVIGGETNPYMRRWWAVPRNPVLNLYLHEFWRSDDDRALHDHPWLFNISILLDGRYLEHTFAGIFLRKTGAIKFRWGRAPHRVELLNGQKCVTLFITGPRVRQWGFYCPQGWKHWRDFTAPGAPGEIGKGCE